MFFDKLIQDHLPFINDSQRINFYKENIQAQCNNKICVDVGAGTGILTDLALDGNAKKVYCVEIKKRVCQFLREKYKNNNKVEVVEANFLDVHFEDAELYFLEQTGFQFNNNFLLKQFFQKIKTVPSIPNRYTLRAYIFDGIINDKPHFLVDNKSFPKNYFAHCMKQQTIKPTEVIDVYELTAQNAAEPLRFKIDLTGYKECTIFLDDDIFQDKDKSNGNLYIDWPDKPFTIHIKKAMRSFSFKWANGTMQIE